MKNYIQAGLNVTVVAAAAVLSGGGVLVGAMFGVASAAAAIGEEVVLVRQGVFTLPKLSAQAWAVGDKIYWDDGAGQCTTVALGNTLIGMAHAVAANPTATGEVLLPGVIGETGA